MGSASMTDILTSMAPFTQLMPTDVMDMTESIKWLITQWLDCCQSKLPEQHQHFSSSTWPPMKFPSLLNLMWQIKYTRNVTRPVGLDLTTLPHGLNKWIDYQLQPIATSHPLVSKALLSSRKHLVSSLTNATLSKIETLSTKLTLYHVQLSFFATTLRNLKTAFGNNIVELV